MTDTLHIPYSVRQESLWTNHTPQTNPARQLCQDLRTLRLANHTYQTAFRRLGQNPAHCKTKKETRIMILNLLKGCMNSVVLKFMTQNLKILCH